MNLDSTNIATIVVGNGLGKTVEFHSALVDCNCISANVPKANLLAGTTEKLRFDLAVSKNEKRTEKTFGIAIAACGGAGRIILRLKAKIAGVVSIGAESIVVDTEKTSSNENLFTRRVAITTTDLALLKDSTISFSSDLSDKVAGQVCFEDGKAFLELSVRLGPMKENQLVGELFLDGPAFSRRAIEITIRQKPPFEIHPKSLVFTSKNDTALSASATVRVKKGSLKD